MLAGQLPRGSQPFSQVSLCLDVRSKGGAVTRRKLLRHSCFTGQYKLRLQALKHFKQLPQILGTYAQGRKFR